MIRWRSTVNFTAQGNQIHESSVFERTDGTTGTIVDAWFNVDNVASKITTPLNNDLESLPNIRGFGDVPTLLNAMSNDSALVTLVNSAVTLPIDQINGLRGITEQIIYRWTGTQDIAVNSRGTNFDGRKLAVLEKFVGRSFINITNQTNPNVQAAALLNNAWNKLVTTVQSRFVIAGTLKDSIPATVYDFGGDRLISVYNIDEAIEQLKAAQPTDTLETAKYWSAMIPVINRLADDSGGDSTTTAHIAKVTAVLNTVGLGKFANFLNNGAIYEANLAESNTLSKNGIFTLTDNADTVYIAGNTSQAVYGLNGNDTMFALTSANTTVTVMLDGGEGNDVLRGTENSDWLNGGVGADTLIGLNGNDTYVIDQTGDLVRENRNEGNDTVKSSLSYLLVDNVENLILQGTGDLNGTGNALNNNLVGTEGKNLLIGNEGNDTLDGGIGIDTLIGGTGNDTYMVDNSADVVREAWNAGNDTVQSSVTYTLAKYLDNLTLLGTESLDGTGNALNNIITGNTGDNRLDGKLGDDILIGLAGNDTYVVDSTADQVIENANAGTDSIISAVNYVLSVNVENLTLIGEADLNGVGNAAANTLTGNTGANSLDGKAGIDTLIGGDGDDTYVVDNSADVVIEQLNEGLDSVNSSVSYILSANVENLTLLGAGPLTATGNALDNNIVGTTGANSLSGGAGNDTLNGNKGADTLDGGTGDDTYFVDNVNDNIIEAADVGIDTVQSSVSWILGNTFENLTLLGTGVVDGAGNAANNRLIGNSSANVLDGKAGTDTMIGNAGNDTYLVDDLADVVLENRNEGNDILKVNFSYVLGENLEQLVLQLTGNFNGTGNELNNVLTGNSGANILNGKEGNDTLTGGAGADIFQLTTAGSVDIITDFSPVNDIIQLDNIIFPSLGAEGVLDATKLRAGSGVIKAADSNDYLLYNSTDGKLYYDSDAIGSASSPVQIGAIGSNLAVNNSNFVII